MANAGAHKWEFKARFRSQAFGWRSQPAIQRIKQAVSEIKKAARSDEILAAEGAVLFLERVSPALERVDSSSGSIGNAVNNAIDRLVPIIARAQADAKTRDAWLERLWEACQRDEMPYIECLGDYWGELCVSKETASRWADLLIGPSKLAMGRPGDFFSGTSNCLSALLFAGRCDEVLELLEMKGRQIWGYHRFGARALAAMGKTDEAIHYAGKCDFNTSPVVVSRLCEEILLSAGRVDEAYESFAVEANQSSTYLAWFRAVCRKYPSKKPAEILGDLVEWTPGDEGKWFAAAKDAGLFDDAIALANRTPCAPQTLARAARDFAEKNPVFALEAGMAALRWLSDGFGYEITSIDVLHACRFTLEAAGNAGRADETLLRIRELVGREACHPFVAEILAPKLA